MGPRRLGVIGDPVAHSLSPVMHNAALASLGIDATYELWPTTVAELSARVTAWREPDVVGANITVPHKEAMLALVDEVSPTARRIGAVNTFSNYDGVLIGDNTDAYGFATSLLSVAPDIDRNHAIVLGAGGASRAIVVALIDLGFTRISIVNRTVSRAEALADEFGVGHGSLDDLYSLFIGASVLVNATSSGWHGDSPVPGQLMAVLPPHAVVVDLTYRETSFLAAARAHGRIVMDGLGMLIHQGAKSLEIWFGVTPPIDVMTAAVVEEQCRREGSDHRD